MPSASWHYAEAERLLAKASDCVVASITRQLVDLAQVHATLATCDPYELEAGSLREPPAVLEVETTGDRL